MSQVGANVVITYNANNALTINNALISGLAADDFLFY